MVDKILNIIIENNILDGLVDTLLMVSLSTVLAYMLGLPLGILVVITDKNGLRPHKYVNYILGWIINMARSIPFIILLVALIPFTTFIMGTSIGPIAMVVSLTIGAIPFVGRLVEANIKEIDKGVIEAAICMGASVKDVIFHVYLVEATPSLLRGISITSIMLIGYSAMAGAVGGGGLGDIAIRYGFYRFQGDVMMVTLVILVILVEIIQIIFELITKKINKL